MQAINQKIIHLLLLVEIKNKQNKNANKIFTAKNYNSNSYV